MKSFYLDVEVTEKRRLRVGFEAMERPSNDEMLQLLQSGDNHEISDEESLEIVSVDKIGEGEGEDIETDEGEEDEESDEAEEEAEDEGYF